MLADFDEASCSLVLPIVATYSVSSVRWKKADLRHDGGNT